LKGFVCRLEIVFIRISYFMISEGNDA